MKKWNETAKWHDEREFRRERNKAKIKADLSAARIKTERQEMEARIQAQKQKIETKIQTQKQAKDLEEEET